MRPEWEARGRGEGGAGEEGGRTRGEPGRAERVLVHGDTIIISNLSHSDEEEPEQGEGGEGEVARRARSTTTSHGWGELGGRGDSQVEE